MGEISFNYNTISKPQHEFVFRYWYENSIEYSFAYQRYIAFSDASIFNSPVAITKVATGLSQLYDLFVDKHTHSMAYFNLMHHFNIMHDVQEQNLSFINKTQKDIEHNKMLGAIPPYLSSLSTCSSIVSLREENKQASALMQGVWIFTNKHVQLYQSYSTKRICENQVDVHKNMYAIQKNLRLNVYKEDNMSFLFDNKFNIYDVLMTQKKYDNITNKFINIMAIMPDHRINIYKNINIGQYKPQLNIMPLVSTSLADVLHMNVIQQMYVRKAKDNYLNVYNNVLAQATDKQTELIPILGLSKEIYTIQRNKILEGVKNINKAFYQQTLNVYAYDKPICLFNIDTFAIQETKRSFIMQSQYVNPQDKITNIINNTHIIKQGPELFIQDINWVSTTNNDISIFRNALLFKDKHNLSMNTMIDLYKETGIYNHFNDINAIDTINKELIRFHQGFYISKHENNMKLYETIFMYRDNKDLPHFIENPWLTKQSNNFSINENIISIYRSKSSTSWTTRYRI